MSAADEIRLWLCACREPLSGDHGNGVCASCGMHFDGWKLGYRLTGVAFTVHYPYKSKDDGIVRYAQGGFPFDPRAEIARTPESERSRLWSQMLSEEINA